MPVIGALDVGSNTVRLLVANAQGRQLQVVFEDRALVRLGESVDQTGRMRDERLQLATDAIRRFAECARALDARPILAVATSAIRDAENGRDFVRRVEETTGVRVEIISGTREAYLTFLGATMGEPVKDGTVVVDVGGGSAEIIIADEHGVSWSGMLKLGSGRVTEQCLHHDPPTQEELGSLRQFVRVALKDVPAVVGAEGLVTGGTASHLAFLVKPCTQTVEVSEADVHRVVERLSADPSETIAERFGLEVERARILPGGLTVIEGIMRHFKLDTMHIRLAGIREGMIIDYLQTSGAWPSM
jgi:exopolyphosphatase/guanosine-5'-triphosphate,3'-diphosphate pyrophosphatase